MSRGTVLLVTHRRDTYTIDQVANALRARGANPVRVDSDRFPMTMQVTTSFRRDGGFGSVRFDDQRIESHDVTAVWLRKIWAPELDSDLAPEHRKACESESRAALLGFLDHLDGIGTRFVNPPDCDTAAENKPKQLRLAVDAGLTIPDTCVSNDPVEVQRFWERIDGGVVAKMLTPYSVTMDGSGDFVHTSRLDRSDLDDLEGLSLSPMVFQSEIAKQEELRVTFVNGEFFVGAISASDSSDQDTSADWRTADPAQCRWRVGELSEASRVGVARLMHDLGLTFGALDFIRTPDGSEVFLEVNPRGEWGMLERDLDFPISAAIADALLLGSPFSRS